MEINELNTLVYEVQEAAQKGHTKISKDTFLKIEEVYHEITKLTGRGRILKKDCQACLLKAYLIINNYVNFYIGKKIEAPTETINSFEFDEEEKITIVKVSSNQKKKPKAK